MEYIKEISPEQAVILWQESRLSLSKCYEKAPEILKVHGSVIGTLGNFSASIGKAKSKKTFNVSAIVAAALKNGTVLRYAAELPEEKRKVLYIDTEQSPYHCLKVMKRILRMAELPDDRDSGYLEFLALRKYTPEQRISIVEQAIYHSPDIGLLIIDGILCSNTTYCKKRKISRAMAQSYQNIHICRLSGKSGLGLYPCLSGAIFEP